MSLNRVSIADVTLTMAEKRHPRSLFKYFKQQGMGVEERSPGIYAIEGAPFPIQVIESKKLPEEENIWFRGLSEGLSVKKLERLMDLKNVEYADIPLSAYLYAVLSANPKILDQMEVSQMGRITLAQVLEKKGFTKEWEARGEKRGEARGEKRGEARGEARGEKRGEAQGVTKTLTVIRGLKNNVSPEQLAKETNLSLEEIEGIKSEII
jgi:hypothetical protein